jgi:tRNA threonylcarbamoyladenosine biosynthesis protein TsaE
MTASVVLQLDDEAATENLAIKLASCLPESLLMTFSGEIGAGKTTFIRAMLRALGIQSAIKSPTFSLVESYSYKDLQIHHFDLYRIQEACELEYLGFRDFFSGNAIFCIEWPEHAENSLSAVDLQFTLQLLGTRRQMQISALTVAGLAVLSYLTGEA